MDKQKIKRKGDSAADRLSNLPSNVIADILKFLPLCDAVRTSKLSRKWRYRWQIIPYLIFDKKFLGEVDSKYHIETVIYQVLLLRKAPIVKFMVKFDYQVDPGFKDVVNHWLQFLSNHRIEELELCFSNPINLQLFSNTLNLQLLSHHLFTFDQLKHLSLLNCKLRPPSTFKGFGRLLTLNLKNVQIEDGEFKNFISNSPMLEHLFLYNSHVVPRSGQLDIHAPHLKSFGLSFWTKLPLLSLRSSPFLEEVTISFQATCAGESFQCSQSNLIEFFGQISSIKKLKLNHGFIELLGGDDVLQKLPVNLSYLLLLQLHINFGDIAQLRLVVSLIKSAPNLRTLQIASNASGLREMKPAALFLKAQQKGELTLTHLKDVWIKVFSGSEPEMEFAKLLLSAATALKELHLILSYNLKHATEVGYGMLKTLAGFPRASPEAKIIFEDNSDKVDFIV